MNKTEKIYIAYKPCKKPSKPLFSNGKFGMVEAPGIDYYEDEQGYYFIRGEFIVNKD